MQCIYLCIHAYIHLYMHVCVCLSDNRQKRKSGRLHAILSYVLETTSQREQEDGDSLGHRSSYLHLNESDEVVAYFIFISCVLMI